MDKKPINGAGLHKFVATGGKPQDYEDSKGLSDATVPNLPSESEENSKVKGSFK